MRAAVAVAKGAADGSARYCSAAAGDGFPRFPAMSADLLVPARIDIVERWESQAAVEAFPGSGSSEEMGAAMLSDSVSEYDVADVRRLT